MTVTNTIRRSAAAASGAGVFTGALWGVYLNAVGIAAARSLTLRENEAGAEPVALRFRILVPAHNEAKNICGTLDSLQAVDYPDALVEVHVVADNCTDETAAIARSRGVNVHERFDTDHPGKGPALAWLIDQLAVGGIDDCVVVVDADTSVCPGLLRAFEREFARGGAVVQGQYKVKDAHQGGEIGFRAAALAVRHLVRPAGRTALGGSSSLYGNGMAFREPIARRYRWSDSLTEDLEMGLRLLLDGHTVGFAADAAVEAEMPATLEDATSQNERWEAGRFNVAREYVPRLLDAAVTRSHGRRWAYIDAAIDISLPPLTTVVVGSAAGGAGVFMLARGRVRRLGATTAAVAVGLQVVHVVHALRLSDAPPEVRRSLLRAPVHVVWKSRLILRLLHRRPESWIRTTRRPEAARS